MPGFVVAAVFGEPAGRFAEEGGAEEDEAGEEDLTGDGEAPSVWVKLVKAHGWVGTSVHVLHGGIGVECCEAEP